MLVRTLVFDEVGFWAARLTREVAFTNKPPTLFISRTISWWTCLSYFTISSNISQASSVLTEIYGRESLETKISWYMHKFALSIIHARIAGGTDTTKLGCCTSARVYITKLRRTRKVTRTGRTVRRKLTFALFIRSLALAEIRCTVKILAAGKSYRECFIYDVAAATASVRWR